MTDILATNSQQLCEVASNLNKLLQCESPMHQLLEGIPLILALCALVCCAFRLRFDKRGDMRLIMLLCIMAIGEFFLAQTGWWQTYLTGGSDSYLFAKDLGILFNSMVMVIFILVSLPRKRKP
jgi:hypothetical protein